MQYPPSRLPPEPKFPAWFKAWFALCALAGLSALCGLGFLVAAIIDWLGRH